MMDFELALMRAADTGWRDDRATNLAVAHVEKATGCRDLGMLPWVRDVAQPGWGDSLEDIAVDWMRCRLLDRGLELYVTDSVWKVVGGNGVESRAWERCYQSMYETTLEAYRWAEAYWEELADAMEVSTDGSNG